MRAVEAWLLADTERIAAFLRIARVKVPGDPETLDNPKATMVALARAASALGIVRGHGRANRPAMAVDAGLLAA